MPNHTFLHRLVTDTVLTPLTIKDERYKPHDFLAV